MEKNHQQIHFSGRRVRRAVWCSILSKPLWALTLSHPSCHLRIWFHTRLIGSNFFQVTVCGIVFLVVFFFVRYTVQFYDTVEATLPPDATYSPTWSPTVAPSMEGEAPTYESDSNLDYTPERWQLGTWWLPIKKRLTEKCRIPYHLLFSLSLVSLSPRPMWKAFWIVVCSFLSSVRASLFEAGSILLFLLLIWNDFCICWHCSSSNNANGTRFVLIAYCFDRFVSYFRYHHLEM